MHGLAGAPNFAGICLRNLLNERNHHLIFVELHAADGSGVEIWQDQRDDRVAMGCVLPAGYEWSYPRSPFASSLGWRC